jgi:hypothetical protein
MVAPSLHGHRCSTYSESKWVVTLVGKNLSDETNIDFGGDTALTGTITQDTGNSYYSSLQRPASIGLQATYNFF